MTEPICAKVLANESKCRVVNKDGWNYDQDLEEFLRILPKVELHVHLDGSFEHSILHSHLQSRAVMDQKLDFIPEISILPWDQSQYPIRQLLLNCTKPEIKTTAAATTTTLHSSNNSNNNNGNNNFLFPQFHSLCTCRNKQSLHEMIKCFELILPIVRGNLVLIEQLAHDFVKRQADDNVIYTEVRYSPHLLAINGTLSSATPIAATTKTTNLVNKRNVADDVIVEEKVDPIPIVQAVTRGLRKGQAEYNVTVNQILCGITWRPDWTNDVVQLAFEHQHDAPCAIVGIDIAAGEEHFNNDTTAADATAKSEEEICQDSHVTAFARAKELGLNVTMHAGEVGSYVNIEKAIQVYNAKRVGHGYSIVENVSLMNHMAMEQIHFEVCPTSSKETGGWKCDVDAIAGTTDWRQHPLIDMIQNGMNVGLNSDDPAVFDTSLTFQYRIAASKMGLLKEQLVQLVFNAIDGAFIDEAEKDELRIKVRQSLESAGHTPLLQRSNAKQRHQKS